MPEIECERHHACLSVPDIRAAVDFYTNRLGFFCAFTYEDPPTFAGVNRPYGIRDYTIRDLNGYSLSFGHHLLDAGPPLKIEPHTKGTLAYIQELKKKHGIDYDSHASYRFVE